MYSALSHIVGGNVDNLTITASYTLTTSTNTRLLAPRNPTFPDAKITYACDRITRSSQAFFALKTCRGCLTCQTLTCESTLIDAWVSC